MEKLDPNLEAQVWRRIGGQPRPERGDLGPLLMLAWEQASVLQHLVGLLTGKQRERARVLAGAALEAVQAQKGILYLNGQPVGKLQPIPIPREPARRLLEKHYQRSGRLMTEYMARTVDPAFGSVYQTLAERERENAVLLAQLLGTMDGQ